MLNHISVRQMETAENRERLDKLYSKIDDILNKQADIMRHLGAPETARSCSVDSSTTNSTGDPIQIL